MIKFRGLGQKGVNADLPAYDLEVNELSEASNVRFFDGTARSHSHHDDAFSATIQSGGTELQAWLDRDNATQYAYSTADTLYRWDGSAFQSASSGLTSSSVWDSVVFGDSVIFNNGADQPQMLENGDTSFSTLTGWDSNNRCKVIRRFKNFLVALYITESGTQNANKVLWSDESETDSVPDNWTITDPASLAGDNIISSDDGEIIDGFELGDVFIIYTKRSIYEMSFIGAPLVMSFRKISANTLIGRKAVASFDNYHFCIGEREIYTHDGQTINHIADQRVKDRFFSGLVDRDSIRIEHNPVTKEVWVLSDSTNLMIYCYRWNTFTFCESPSAVSLRYGFLPTTAVTYADWQTAGLTYEDLGVSFAELTSGDLVPTMLILSSGALYRNDYFLTGGTSFTASIEREGLDLDELTSTKEVKLIQRIFPQVKGSGNLSLQLGYSDTPGSMVTWLPTQDYDLEADHYFDQELAARYLAYRFTSSGTFRFSGMDVETQIIGER